MDVKTKGGGHYPCPKCSGRDWDVGEIRASGGVWSSILDVENKYFTHLTCTKCSYTEFYKVRSSDLASITDFIIG
jgi:uncharacterized protein